jgi:ribosome-associated GTPase EngA
MSKPIVAIVARPNVGKSTLFNKIVGERISIVEDTPGVTRDRIYADAEWLGKPFLLVDTGGIEPSSQDTILMQMKMQAEVAVKTSDVIIFLTDIQGGVTATDQDVAQMLQKSGKPVVLAVNKVDNPGEPPLALYEFYNLGMGDPFAISASHGLGLGDLLDEVFSHIGEIPDQEYDEDAIKVAVIGRPNAGKSSIINHILGESRLIVSDIAGTTRDAVDTEFEKDGQDYIFIDTAGLRRKSRVDERIEKYSIIRSMTAIERSDVCLIMIDAAAGVTEQDSKVAGYAHEEGRGIVIVVNKWDLIEKDDKTMSKFREDVYKELGFMTYAPILFISAKTGQRVDKLFELIKFVSNQNAMRISTGMLNDVLNDATARVQPPTDKGKRLKIYYMTQVSVKPPTFTIFVNSAQLFHFSYQRYLENQLRDRFGFEGTTIRFIIRERGDRDKK